MSHGISFIDDGDGGGCTVQALEEVDGAEMTSHQMSNSAGCCSQGCYHHSEIRCYRWSSDNLLCPGKNYCLDACVVQSQREQDCLG